MTYMYSNSLYEVVYHNEVLFFLQKELQTMIEIMLEHINHTNKLMRHLLENRILNQGPC